MGKKSHKNYCVVKKKLFWAVTRDGFLSSHRTQKEAIASGRRLARIVGGRLTVCASNGKVRSTHNYPAGLASTHN